MTSRVDEIRAEAEGAIATATDTHTLEDVRIEYLGRKAELPNLLRNVAQLPASERAATGKAANEARKALEVAIERRAQQLAAQELEQRLERDRVDVTLPADPAPHLGRLHLITETRREIEDVFIGLAFNVAEGPEVETVYYNFDALNHAPTHPSRLMTDTFYVAPAPDIFDPKTRLLRVHTSPMQIRAMERQPPPIYIIVPGRTYRPDNDATHTPQFHQIEGLAVDSDITLGDLQGTLLAFARAIFGEDRQVRLRPHFFPFTEPSVEVDVSCFNC
ncbi:MAG TPA: phenylalanine--tRNA ligase subunit alpha, partial [Solirubrobacteraceae bacterium]